MNLASTYLEGFESPEPDVLPRRYHYATPTFHELAGISPYFHEVKLGLIDASASNLSTEWAAGGLISSPQDLCTFALALRDGPLLHAEGMAILKDWKTLVKEGQFMGHGLFRTKTDHRFACGHGGSVLGFNGAFLWMENVDLVIAVGANVGTMHVGKDTEGTMGAGNVLNDTELIQLALEFLKEV